LILVFASELDEVARDATTDWSEQEAVLLTPADIFCKGWRTRIGGVRDWSIVANGQQWPIRSVSGVVSRLPCILARELFDIQPDDRPFAAAEATAFALFFLSSIPCPVVNRPTPNCLNGPNWQPEQWVRACLEAVVPFKASCRRTNEVINPETASSCLRSVIVLAGKCLEDTSDGCLAGVLRLARLANVTFLQVYFMQDKGETIFYRAELTPDLSKVEIRNALREYFDSSKWSW